MRTRPVCSGSLHKFFYSRTCSMKIRTLNFESPDIAEEYWSTPLGSSFNGEQEQFRYGDVTDDQYVRVWPNLSEWIYERLPTRRYGKLRTTSVGGKFLLSSCTDLDFFSNTGMLQNSSRAFFCEVRVLLEKYARLPFRRIECEL